jgi:adenosylmethionine-8-amino-7-oxononanoate aminotransferase
MTLAAALASARVADTISNGRPSAFMHGPTFMANPLACAAASASLDLFAASDYAANAKRIEGWFSSRLMALKNLPNVADVRILGAVAVVEMQRLPSQADISDVIDRHGVWLRPFCNFIYSMPPLVSDEQTIDRISSAIMDLASRPPDTTPMDPDFHE